MTDICRMQKEDIDISKLIAETRDAADGAQLLFIGTVRDDGMESLEIEAFVPAADKDLAEISEEAKKIKGVRACHIVHRYGRLEIGETIMVSLICAAHRGEAYEASRFVIEKIKEKVPIWKQELLSGGEKGEWVH